MQSFFSVLSILASVFIFVLLHNADGIAVMSVDFGSEWMKIAIVSPGVPMEIVLNKESKRKTPVAISFRNSEREIGDSAHAQGVRFPETTYTHLLDLLGKEANNTMVELYKKRFPHHQISADPETGTVLFRKDDNSTFSVEELLSMILHRARELAQDFAAQTIKDMVVTIPAFFNQAERRAILRAAELSNIKILQLINDNTAVALNYGVFRRKTFNSTIQYIMFYDMGASSTKATVAGYQVVKTKEKGYSESNPQLTILGMGFDRTLGGLEFTLRLRNHLAKVFNKQKKTPTDVFTSPRAMAKLLKESERVKMILSANTDHIAQVENLIEEQDFKSVVQRSDFEELCSDLFERVSNPVNDALKQAGMTMDVIDQVILVGAGTRVPKVQEKLLEAVGKSELGKSLNTDEAAALGAVYQAAHLSQGFKVKKFLIKDAVQFPIQVDFEREYDTEDNHGTKIVTRTLFGFLNPYPVKKVLTFNRLTKNEFQFNVNYGDLNLPLNELKVFRSMNISKVHLSGIQDALSKHSNDGSEPKGIKAHFRMDESGILSLDQVESVFEMKEEESESEGETESAFSKLGNTISKFFTGGGGEAEKSEKEGKEKTEQESTEQKVEEKSDSINATNTTSEETQQQLNQTEHQKNATVGNETEALNNTKKETKKSKIVTIKEPISITQERLDVIEPSPEKLQDIIKRIELFNTEERLRKEKEEAKNNLESFILDTQDKLYQTEYEMASTEEEREKIRTDMSTISDWLYEEEEESDIQVYQGKLKELQTLTRELFVRVREHKDRPEVLTSLHNLLNVSEIFLQRARVLPEEEQYYTPVELDTLEKVINDTKQWKTEKEAIQEKQPLTEMPKLTVRSIAEKISILDREVKYLLNKARTFKPSPKKTKNETTSKNETNQDNEESVDEPTEKSDKENEKPSENEIPEGETQQETNQEESTPLPKPSKPEDGHTEL